MHVNGIVEQVMRIPERIERKSSGKAEKRRAEEGTGIKIRAEEGTGINGSKIQNRNLGFSEKIDSILIHPVLGIPVLFLILYFGLYLFVGVFAAGTVVDFLENTVFGGYINPFVTEKFVSLVPYPALQDLFVGEYGIFTQAVTYAIALILPIVGAFFLVFSIIEDTGYLPRLGLLLDGMSNHGTDRAEESLKNHWEPEVLQIRFCPLSG